MEPVYRTLEFAAASAVRATGTRIGYHGLENIPATGGAVIAINHTGYVDWLPAGLAARRRRRRLRFMIKAEMQEVRVVGFLIRRTRTIPVDRRAGAGAYAVAVQRLRAGELVAVYPEATISRSLELKEFKTGAARMALEAQVPIVPMVIWGAQRVWTKDQPKALGRNKFPVDVVVGAPIPPAGAAAGLEATLRASMSALLDWAQSRRPHPQGAPWMPHRLGGGAPTPAEARRMDDAETAERERRRHPTDDRPDMTGSP